MQTEAFTPAHLRALKQKLSPTAQLVARLNKVDMKCGRGILDGDVRCVWDNKGHRITINPVEGGGVVLTHSREPDPECPAVVK